MNLVGPLLFLIGGFSFSGGIFDWDWFMQTRKARGLVGVLGRTGARITYVILGILVMILGVLGAFDLF